MEYILVIAGLALCLSGNFIMGLVFVVLACALRGVKDGVDEWELKMQTYLSTGGIVQ